MREMLNTTTCVIDGRAYQVCAFADGVDLIDLEAKGCPREYIKGGDILDGVTTIYGRAAEGKRIVKESAV